MSCRIQSGSVDGEIARSRQKHGAFLAQYPVIRRVVCVESKKDDRPSSRVCRFDNRAWRRSRKLSLARCSAHAMR